MNIYVFEIKRFFHDNICHPILNIKYQFIYNTMYNETNRLTLSFTVQLG